MDLRTPNPKVQVRQIPVFGGGGGRRLHPQVVGWAIANDLQAQLDAETAQVGGTAIALADEVWPANITYICGIAGD